MDKTAIQEIVKGAATGKVDTTLPINFVMVPEGYKLHDVSAWQYAKAPMLKRAAVRTTTVDSFVRYWSLFSSENSRLFGDREKLTFTGKLDYHGVGEQPASHMQHSVELTLKTSIEWQTWQAQDRKQMGQAQFVEFLEDNAPDVIEPTSATMLELARDLQVKSDASFASAIKLSNGQVQLSYQENVSGSFGGGKIEVPEVFKLKFPVFDGCASVEITARLRYRTNSGKLTIWYEIVRAKKILDAEFDAASKAIAASVQSEIIMGGLI